MALGHQVLCGFYLFLMGFPKPIGYIIELGYGKNFWKTLYLMVKTMVSCRFSLNPMVTIVLHDDFSRFGVPGDPPWPDPLGETPSWLATWHPGPRCSREDLQDLAEGRRWRGPVPATGTPGGIEMWPEIELEIAMKNIQNWLVFFFLHFFHVPQELGWFTTGWCFGTFFMVHNVLGIILPTDYYFLEGLKPPTREWWWMMLSFVKLGFCSTCLHSWGGIFE